MYRNNKKGFTLIELLVVIAIIGILSSVVLASLNSARQKSRDARRLSDVKQLQLALELHFDTDAAYPTTAEGLAKLATDNYIATIPDDPLNAAYEYESTSVTSYCIGGTLEDSAHSALDSADPSCLATGGDPDELSAAINYALSP